jgi:DNA-binding NarL/FixJ family response regulator
MSANILIVEDEGLVGLELSYLLQDMGHHVVGVASDAAESACLVCEEVVDMALVDLNLADGPTGAEIGRKLADEHGVSVVYTTANPAMLGDGVPGTLGVLPKPYAPDAMAAAVEYALRLREGGGASPPRRLRVFDRCGARASR